MNMVVNSSDSLGMHPMSSSGLGNEGPDFFLNFGRDKHPAIFGAEDTMIM